MTTILAVRHADIDLPTLGTDPSLNSAGAQRALALAQLTGSAGISTILTSQFTRTKLTVAPTAQLLGLVPTVTPPPQELAQQVRAGHLGNVILIAGHSNTIPEVVAAFGAAPVPTIGERDFDNLFIITVLESNLAGLLHLHYSRTP